MENYLSSEEAIARLSNFTEFSDEQRKVLEHKGGCCIVATAGAGKALVNGSKVLCYSLLCGSYFKNIEEVKVNELVMDKDGKIQLAIGVFPQGEKEVYEVHFSDKTSTYCCIEHLWSVILNGEMKEVLTTGELIKLGVENNTIEVPVSAPVDLYNGVGIVDRAKHFKELIDKHSIFEGKELFIDCSGLDMDTTADIGRSLGYICTEIIEKNMIKVNAVKGVTYLMNTNLNVGKKTIVSITATGEKKEMTCIKVSGRAGLFVTDNFVVTHNTTLLTNLITKRILTGELEPSKLVATTFSLDGANEMNKRLEVMFDRNGISWAKKYAKIKTIHALCLQILQELGIPCNVVSGLERYRMILDALKMAEVHLEKEDIDELDSLLGYQINKMMNDHDVVTSARYNLELDEETYTRIRQYFNMLKQQEGVIDYEDMLFKTYCQLYAPGREDIRQYFQNKWKYFYIDEAQDTSLIQYRIMQALISDPDKIMIIGDDDQAIYSWRGASPEVLLNVCCDYSIKKLYLSTNYRCGRNIVDFSATGVKNNSIREEKKMLAYNDGGVIEFKPTSTELYDCSNDVAKLIKELHDKDGVDYEDICVLARYNQDLSLLNSILFNQGIYTHIPREATITYGKLFKDFKGLIDFIGGEDWLLDKSTIALNGWKIASYFDKKTSKLISNGMKSTGYNTVKMLECIADSSNNDIVCSSIRNRMKFETISDIKNFVRIIKSKNTNEDKAIAILKHHIGVTSWLYRSDRSKRLVNGTFKLFRDMLKVYGFVEARRMIRNIELYEKGQIASIGSCVNLSTCHRSKGREWRVVILLADDNKSFPSLEDINRCCTNGVSREDIYSWIEEERRLHYVAKTRAKEKLILAFDKDDMSLFTLECFGNYYSSEDIINIANKGVPKPETDLESAKKIGVVLE